MVSMLCPVQMTIVFEDNSPRLASPADVWGIKNPNNSAIDKSRRGENVIMPKV